MFWRLLKKEQKIAVSRTCSTKKMIVMKLSDFNNSKKIVDDSNECSFTSLLQTRWDEIHREPDVFRYKIDRLQEKTVGEYLLQLNPKRSSQRRAPEHVDAVGQPFDHSRFNFTKASPREVLFNVVQDGDESNVHALLVNVSPINRYHSLLCPSVQRCLPQVATEESLLLVLEIMFTAQDRNLRIGFNSLCAFASVNHLHYHLFLLESRTLPVETAECEHIVGHLHYLSNYPAPALCFDIPDQRYISQIARDTYTIIKYLLQNSIAHNLMVAWGRNACMGDVVRVVLWPRKSSAGAKNLADFNVATCELSGWFPVYNAQSYNCLTKEDLEFQLKKWKWDDFERLCEEVKLLL